MILVGTTVIWGGGVIQQNQDRTQVAASENFMQNLDNNIKDVISFGGSDSIDFNLNGYMNIISDNTLELSTNVNVNLPNYWINVTSDTSYIQELYEGGRLRIQLIYPTGDFGVQFFTNGPLLARPKTITIAKNSTFYQGNIPFSRIEIELK